MALVVTHWRLPEEEQRFLDYLERTDEVLAVIKQNSSRRESFVPRPVRDVIGEDPRSVLLVRAENRELLRLVPFRRSGATWYYGIDAMRSPVIDFLRGRRLGRRRLGQSNIAAYTEYPDEDGTAWVQQPQSFVNWAKRVAAWVRKFAPFHYQYRTYRITAGVKDEVDGGLELVP